MSEIEVVCAGCGAEFTLTIEGSESRWLRAMAKRVRCETCSDAYDAEQAERERRAARDARRDRCQLPRRLRGELLEHFPAKPSQLPAVEAAKRWASEADPGGLMLLGPTGTGKTRIAAAACWTRIERYPCTYASVARAMSRLSASLTDEGRREAVRVFSGNGAAVLDDFDKTRPSEFGKEQIFAAIDGREQAGAPLLVTTNLLPSEIAERFGEPVASRLAGYCTVVEVGGDDLRLVA